MQLNRKIDELRSLERRQKKQRKLERHKEWKKRHKKRLQKEKRQLEKRNAQWIKDTQWEVTMAPSVNALLLKQKKELAATKKSKKKNSTTASVDESKEKPRLSLELKDLKRTKPGPEETCSADDGNQFFNRIREMETANENKEKEDQEQEEDSDSSELEPNQDEMCVHEKDVWNSLELDKDAYRYWCGADQSLSKLLSTRRLWDKYIRTEPDENDTFRKVPPTFVIPPPPANGVWASYLI